MQPYVYGSVTYNSRNMEAAQVSIDRRLDKEAMANTYYRVLLGHNNE